MTWAIGIDEAGYGPNLGPLVVAATAWKVGDEGSEVRGQRAGNKKAVESESAVDLYARLEKIVSPKPSRDFLAIADSKLLYKPHGGLQLLERGVMTALQAVDTKAPTGWQQLWDATLADPEELRHCLPWYADYDCELPVDAEIDELVDLQKRFQAACTEANVELADLRARAVFPTEFNELTDRYGTKGAALSHISIALLKDVLDNLSPIDQSPNSNLFQITFDKHGGRNRYLGLLQHFFPGEPIEILLESRPASRYCWESAERRVEVTFRTRGEEELPAALASMTAKYHRELAMRAFNAYWAKKVPDLKPTAGYPVDAKRFKAQIADMQKQLGIDDHDLWRNR